MIMLRKAFLLVLITVLSLGLAGCIVRRASDTDTRTESRDVDGFSAIEFAGFGDVKVVQGDEYDVELSGPADLVGRITTEVHGDTLYIGRDSKWELWILGTGNRQVDIAITVPELEKIKVEGAGVVNIDGLEGESFEFDLSGAGELRGRDLKLTDLVVDMSGAGSARLTGSVDTQKVVISGAGEYDAQDLESRTTSVDMSGAGSAKVWATETLDVDASGAGSVKYWGEPDVRQEVSGAGSVSDEGAR